MVRKTSAEFVEAVISEARNISGFLVEIERGKCGGDVEVAIHRTAVKWGVEESSIRSLRYRWRELHDVRASVLERLREAYEAVYERQCAAAAIEREIDAVVSSVPNSRGGAGGAQDEGAATAVAPSTISATSPRDTVSRADDLPAKQPRSSEADLQLEKEH